MMLLCWVCFVLLCYVCLLALSSRKKFLVIAVKQMHVTWGVAGGCVGYFSKTKTMTMLVVLFGFMGLSAYMRKNDGTGPKTNLF